MTVVTGQRDTNNVTSTILARDIRKEILLYDQDLTPLVVLSSQLGGGSVECHNPKFEWYEEDRDTRRDTSTTTGSTATQLTVGDATLWAEHDIWQNTVQGEVIRVVSVDSATQVTVVRDLAGAGASTFASGDEYLRIGTAKQEGDTSVQSRSGNPTAKFNYTQIFEKTYSMTGTAQNTANYTAPHDWDFRAMRAMQEFKLDQEFAYWFGVKSLNTSGEHPRRTSQGVLPTITTNVNDAGGTMTEAEWWSYYSAGFRYSNSQKVKFGFAARTPIDVVNGYPRGKLEVIQADQDATYGLSIMKFRHPHGTVNLMTHNLFSDSTSTYSKYIVVLDMIGNGNTLVRRRYLQNRDTQIVENVQEQDRDGRKDRIFSECGLELGLEKSHFVVKNITG